ncbi:MAG: hypothetical protein WAK60_06430 [Sedimentisphaerales bacterium]
MQLYVINPRVLLRNRLLSGLFTITVVCIVFLMACVGLSSDPNNPAKGAGSESAADVNNASGPTVMLSYSRRTFKKNPISSFMYFIPLISPTFVDRETSANNEQQVGIVSYKRTVTSNYFYVTCEFEILGKGFHKNTFDPVGMIAEHTGGLKEGESLIATLDYIKFEGEGFGRIEVEGTITGPTPTVTEVDICFNARDQKSPVTIGLYSIKPQNGQYKYENRYNEIIARVDTLTFKKSETPRMGIEIASIHKNTEDESYWGTVKAVIANFFISPPRVTKLGNDTMLNFGYTLLKQKPAFTFPRAKNLRKNRRAAIDNKQNYEVARNKE